MTNDIKMSFGDYKGLMLSEIRVKDAVYLTKVVEDKSVNPEIVKEIVAFMEECNEYKETVERVKGQKLLRSVRDKSGSDAPRKVKGSRGKRSKPQPDASMS